jgi:hypothetical protein
MRFFRPLSAVFILSMAALSVSAEAQHGPWGRTGWDSPQTRPDFRRPADASGAKREGRVTAAHFVAEGQREHLGKGVAAIVAAPGGSVVGAGQAAFEAAVEEQLVRAGYDTATRAPDGGQIAEVRVVRDIAVPAQQKRSPVSGEASVGLSNHGSAMGVAINVDMTKPRTALLATRMETRILDRATGQVLWEGRAAIETRDGDPHWTDQEIAARLAGAMFENFLQSTGT